MAEEQQVTKEPQQITTKDLKKVEVGKRLAAHSRRKRELKVKSDSLEGPASGAQSRVSQYYNIRAVVALRVIGWLGYYIY